MNITNQILVFVKFLNLNYQLIRKQIETNNSLDDYETHLILNNWFQFNWEIIVESSICSNNEFIEYYNEGADVFDDSYRVTCPGIVTTHKIVCKSRNVDSDIPVKNLINGENIDFSNIDFLCFVNFDGIFYSHENEFQYALFEDQIGEKYIVAIEEIEFYKQIL